MIFGVEIADDARREAIAAAEWITRSSPTAAAQWYMELEASIESLGEMPHRCPIVAESETLGVEDRRLLFGSYRILFTIRGSTVFVLHVRHAARRPL